MILSGNAISAKNILVIHQKKDLGNSILASAFLRLLSQNFSHSTIDVIATPRQVHIMEQYPFINQVFGLERREPDKKILQTLVGKYQLVIVLTDYIESMEIAKKIGGFSVGPFSELDFHVGLDDRLYRASKYLKILDILGLETFSAKPVFYLKDDVTTKVKEIFEERFDLKKPIIGFHVGASHKTKTIPIDQLLAIFDDLGAEYQLAIFCGPDEEDISSLLEQSQWDIFKGLSIEELACAIALCDYFIGNDSGPSHLAYALNIPALVLHQSCLLKKQTWKPASELVAFLHPFYCEDCYTCNLRNRRNCPNLKGNDTCFQKIEVKDILEIFFEHSKSFF